MCSTTCAPSRASPRNSSVSYDRRRSDSGRLEWWVRARTSSARSVMVTPSRASSWARSVSLASFRGGKHIGQMVLELVTGDVGKHACHGLPWDSFGDDVIGRKVLIKVVGQDHVCIPVGKAKLTFVRLGLPETCRWRLL